MFATKVKNELSQISMLKDVQFGQPMDYPTLEINIDRERAGQLGVTVERIGRSLVAATSSSRFVQPNFWRDPASGVAYQVQVEIPQAEIHSAEDVAAIPAMPSGETRPLIGDVAHITTGTMPGEYYRYNMRRMVTITGNAPHEDLGSAVRAVREAINRAGQPPRAVQVELLRAGQQHRLVLAHQDRWQAVDRRSGRARRR